MSDNEAHRVAATYGTIVVKIWRCINFGTGRPLTTVIHDLPCDVIRGSRVSAKAVVEDNHVSHVNIVDSDDEVEVAPRRIKLEEPEAQVQATQTPAATESATTPASGVHERTKKRKALEDELEQIEEEDRLLEARQRKRRVRMELARFEEDN
jgi:hypothetical protein